jgi:hypothetical protein
MRRILALVVLIGVAHVVVRAETDALSSLGFLIGGWQAVDTPPGESGAFTFKLSVQDHIMVRTNEATYAATAERPALRHDDLLVIYGERGSLRADYFDREGHVIRYAVRTQNANVVVFVSDLSPNEPRYRLTYSMAADGVLLGSFEIASPAAPETFKPYLSWKARKR